MVSRIAKKITFMNIFKYTCMVLVVAFCALPLVYVVSTAFKPIDELFLFPPRFFVRKPTFGNFSDLLVALSSIDVPFTRYALNSVIVSSATVVLTVLVCSLCAYGVVVHAPKGKDIFMAIIIAALMFSGHVTQIPTYMVVKNMGLLDTYSSLIIPKVAVAYNMFLMERFTSQIPRSLIEAARVDGAWELTIYWKIVMPSLKPAWATLIVLTFVSIWNDYFSPLIFITKQSYKTLPLALQLISGGVGAAALGRAGAVAAATLIMTVPTVILFMMMQSQVIETMTHSGIK